MKSDIQIHIWKDNGEDFLAMKMSAEKAEKVCRDIDFVFKPPDPMIEISTFQQLCDIRDALRQSLGMIESANQTGG